MKNENYYLNIIKDLTDVLWEEHGMGIRTRTTLVGVDHFNNKYGDKLKKDNIPETLDAVIAALKEEGVAAEATYDHQDIVLKMKFESCTHLDTDKKLLDEGILRVVNCPCANVAMHFVGELTGKFCELAGIEIEDNVCTATIVAMRSQED